MENNIATSCSGTLVCGSSINTCVDTITLTAPVNSYITVDSGTSYLNTNIKPLESTPKDKLEKNIEDCLKNIGKYLGDWDCKYGSSKFLLGNHDYHYKNGDYYKVVAAYNDSNSPLNTFPGSCDGWINETYYCYNNGVDHCSKITVDDLLVFNDGRWYRKENPLKENKEKEKDMSEDKAYYTGWNWELMTHSICRSDKETFEEEKNKPIAGDMKGFIKEVKFSGPATIVFWKDDTKTVVKCSEYDAMNEETAIAMAICKKFFGNNYFRRIERLVDDTWKAIYEQAYNIIYKDYLKKFYEDLKKESEKAEKEDKKKKVKPLSFEKYKEVIDNDDTLSDIHDALVDKLRGYK